MSAGSRSLAARTASWPMPGHAKICSVMTAPATSSGSSSPMTVMIGISEFLNAWRITTVFDFSPFALAATTYSPLSASSMLARV